MRVVDLRNGATQWRLPAGVVAGDTLVHRDGRLVTWYDARTGNASARRDLAVRGAFGLVGLSQGRRLAPSCSARRSARRPSCCSRPSVAHGRPRREQWSFDALRGDKLYLIKQLKNGYQVRLYDLATNTLGVETAQGPARLVDDLGHAVRADRVGGRPALFTLYIGSDGGSMVHELDLAHGDGALHRPARDGDFSAATT